MCNELQLCLMCSFDLQWSFNMVNFCMGGGSHVRSKSVTLGCERSLEAPFVRLRKHGGGPVSAGCAVDPQAGFRS